MGFYVLLRRLFLSQLKVIGLVGHEAINGKEAVEAVSKGQYGLIHCQNCKPPDAIDDHHGAPRRCRCSN